MIVVKLMGGLGNQMFQYAFGRYLSIKHNTELKLDLTYLSDRSPKENFIYRDFQLDVFNIEASFASDSDKKKFEKGRKKKIMHHLSLYSPFSFDYLYLREPYFHFFKRALKAPGNTYTDGYWQSEKYFQEVSGQIRKDFTPKKTLSAKTILLEDEIKKNQSVSIHVRRADYVQLQNRYRYHTCNEKYYYDAMKMISGKIANPKFYVFSDEPEWFKKNIETDFPVEYVDHNTGISGYEDLLLMSCCRHHIIANSTFSWWGAWLNENPGKIIIAPQKWFEDKSMTAEDLLPGRWIRL